MELVTGFNIIVLAYAYHINLFPTYHSLGANKSNKTGMKAVAIGTGLSVLIYVSLGILSIYIFGSDLKSSVLKNVDEENNVYSYIIRIAFLLVLGCHIPYIFFPTKESFLIIFDEAENKSMTKALQYKIQQQEIGVVRDQVTDGEEEGESELAYLKMPSIKYYSLTLFLYTGCILGSIFV
jgi:amino acid permease